MSRRAQRGGGVRGFPRLHCDQLTLTAGSCRRSRVVFALVISLPTLFRPDHTTYTGQHVVVFPVWMTHPGDRGERIQALLKRLKIASVERDKSLKTAVREAVEAWLRGK